MTTRKTIRRRPDIKKNGKNDEERFVISDMMNAFGAYETLEEIDNAWNTIKTAIAPKRIHVEREWCTKLMDCCSLSDFFDFVLPHVSGPVATQIKRARFAKYVKRAMDENPKDFICELRPDTQRMCYGIKGMLYLFGEFGTIQMASNKWSSYKTRLARRGEKQQFVHQIGRKEVCTADDFFEKILPYISARSCRGIIKRKQFVSDLEKESPRKYHCLQETKCVKYDSTKHNVNKTELVLPKLDINIRLIV